MRKHRAESAARPTTRRPVYYGWTIVAVVCFIGLVQTGQFNPTIGVFIKPVTEEFGWSRSVFVGAHSIGTLLGGITGFALGPVVDRYGPRWIVSAGLLLVGGALFSQAFVQEVWQFYFAMIVGRAALQGAVGVAANVTISKWFIRHRGRAIAFSSLGTRVGNGTSPLVAQGLVSAYDWRAGFLALGVITWSALLPAFLWLRREPEDMGLRPDGDPPEADRPVRSDATPPAPREEGESSFTLRQALRTRSLYLLILSMALSAIVASGVSLNLVAYLEDQSLSPATAVVVVTVWSIFSSIGSVGSGLIADRLPVRASLAAIYLGMALSVLILLNVESLPLAMVYAVFYGLLFGTMATLQQMVFPDYYGRAYLGSIRGIATMFQMGAIALGPILAAAVFDATGSYEKIFYGFLGSYVLSGLVLLAAPKPRPPAPREATLTRAAPAG